MSIEVNDIVEFIEPFDHEEGTTYTVLEVNGDRCVIELIFEMRIRPTWTRLVSDRKKVGDANG